MALGVLFLLSGILCTEVAMLGYEVPGVIGAGLLFTSAGVLFRLWLAEHARKVRPVPVRTTTNQPARAQVRAASGR